MKPRNPIADALSAKEPETEPRETFFVRDGWAALLERIRANPERYGGEDGQTHSPEQAAINRGEAPPNQRVRSRGRRGRP